MKKLRFAIFAIALFCMSGVPAQISVHVNIGHHHAMAPERREVAHFYFLPEINAYYDVNTSMYIYLNNGVWIHRSHLPYQYRHFDMNRSHRVLLNDYHGNSPYDHFREHKMKYGNERGHMNDSHQRGDKHSDKGNKHHDRNDRH
jgi:hypothetical protein